MTLLVTGPESSGNRMLCRMMTEAGAAVLHRPMPMSSHSPSGQLIWPDFGCLDWDAAVVIVRDPSCVRASQVAAGHVRDLSGADDRTRAALCRIYSQLARMDKPWWTVTYEGLARPQAVRALCGLLGLDGSMVETTWQDANAKHYGGAEWSDHRRLCDGALPPRAVAQ